MELEQQSLNPLSVRRRAQLKYRPQVVGAAGQCRAVQVSGVIEHHAIERVLPVGTTAATLVQRMEYALRPTAILVRHQLEDRATSVRAKRVGSAATALAGSAIEVAGFVKDQGTNGLTSVVVAVKRVELMNNRFSPGAFLRGRKFVNDATSKKTAIRRPIQVASCIKHHAALGRLPVDDFSLKCINHFFFELAALGRRQLIHQTKSGRRARTLKVEPGCAVQVSLCISDYAANRLHSVPSALKCIKDLLFADRPTANGQS